MVAMQCLRIVGMHGTTLQWSGVSGLRQDLFPSIG